MPIIQHKLTVRREYYLLLACLLLSYFVFPRESLAQEATPTPEPIATPMFASLGDRVWLDTNQNGLQDSNEPGLTSQSIKLWTTQEDGTLDQVISTTATDIEGRYQFVNLEPDIQYVVEFDLEPEQSFTSAKIDRDDEGNIIVESNSIDSDVDPDTGLTALIALLPGEESTVIDAGIIDPRVSVTPTVMLTVTPTITPTVTPTATLTITPTATSTITITPTATPTATLVPTGLIDLGDRAWKDVNNNGLQDEGEPGLAGVIVRLWDVDEAGVQQSALMTTTTDDSGNYLFTDISETARYIIEFEPPENMILTAAQIGTDPALDSDPDPTTGLSTPSELNPGESLLDIDAGFVHPFSALGDRVFEDLNGDGIQDANEAGLDGVQVTLWVDSDGDDLPDQALDTAITSNGGFYTFTQLSPKTRYLLEFTAPAGRVFSPQDQGDDDLADSDVDPVSGLTAVIQFDPGQDNQSYDAGLSVPAEIVAGRMGDRIWLDLNGNGLQDSEEPGIPDVTLSLLDSSANLLTTTLSDGNGNYIFSDLEPGSYTIQVDSATLPEGLEATFDADGLDTLNQISQTIGAEEFKDDLDFGYQLLPAEISGILFEDLDDTDGRLYIPAIDRPLAGVILKFKGFDLFDNPVFRIEQTDLDGRYYFSNLTTGNYTITVDLPSLPAGLRGENSADPDGGNDGTLFVDLPSGLSMMNQDFGYFPARSALGDQVWNDLNQDGIQDPGEPGMANILLNLWVDDDGDTISDTQVTSTTTSAGGNYGFIELNPNKRYFVEVILPDGDGFTAQNQGGDDTADSDVDPATGMIGPISLSPGQDNIRTDAGITTTVEFTPTVTPEPTAEPGPPLLIANSYNASTGDEVVVLLEAFNIPELATATISVKYDPTILEPLSCNKDPDGIFDLNQCNIQFGPDEIRFSIIALQNQSGNIRIAELTFRVIGADGAVSPLIPSFSSNSDDRGNPLEIPIEEGQFYVFDKRSGDVSCDGVQNSIDALFIMQFELGLRETSDTCTPPARESRTLYQPACDVDENDLCNAVDALLILQCNVGLSNPACPDVAMVRSELVQAEDSGLPLPNNIPDKVLGASPLDVANVIYVETIPAGSIGTVRVLVRAELVDGLSSATIQVGYDPALLEAVACNINAAQFPSGICNERFEQDDISPDTIRFNVNSIATNVVGEIKLATIEFDIVDGPLDNAINLALDVKEAANWDGVDIPINVVEDPVATELKRDREVYLPVIHK